MLTDISLTNQKFSEKELKENIHNLSLRKIVLTQHLTADFVVKYILNENFHTCTEDSYIDIYFVLQEQKHLTFEEISTLLNKCNS